MIGRTALPLRRAGRRGTTLLDITVTLGVFAIATSGLLAGILSATRLRQFNAEKAVARNEAVRVLSAMRGLPDLATVYNRFGGGGAGETFAVNGLASPEPDAAPGRVIVWRRKDGALPDPGSPFTWTAEDLQEARSRLWMDFPLPLVGNEGLSGADYLDTNGDGAVNADDRPSLLIVTLRIRWRTHGGVVTEYFSTILGRGRRP